MKQAQLSFRQRHRALLWALGLNLAFLLVALCFSHMQFGTNDDRDISNLLANVYASGNGHYITFVNIILAKSLSWLYVVTGNATNWYVLLSVAVSFGALTCGSYLLLRRAPKPWLGVGLAVVFLGLTYQAHYIVFQFTQNAALYTLVGVLLLVDALLHPWTGSSWLRCAIGVVLALLGSMVRFQSIYFTFPYLALYLGYGVCFDRDGVPLGRWLVSKVRPLLCLAACLVLVCGARQVHQYVYASNPVLNEFYQENLLRSELLDYGFPDYESHLEELASVGLHASDIHLFSAQSFLDRDVYSLDALQLLVDLKDSQATTYSMGNLTLSSLGQVFLAIRSEATQSLLWVGFALSAAFFLLATDRKRWLVLLGSLGLTLGIMWYFLSVGRMPYRVWYSIVTPGLASLLYLCAIGRPKAQIQGKRQSEYSVPRRRAGLGSALGAAGIVLLAAALVIQTGYVAWEDDTESITDEYQQLIEYTQAHPDQLFLIDRPTVSRLTYTSTITPMTCLDVGSQQNVCYMGGWLCWTPANLSTLSRFGTDNVFRSIGEGMEVYLIDNSNPLGKLAFIQLHYNPDVTIEYVTSIPGQAGHDDIGIYRLYLP